MLRVLISLLICLLFQLDVLLLITSFLKDNSFVILLFKDLLHARTHARTHTHTQTHTDLLFLCSHNLHIKQWHIILKEGELKTEKKDDLFILIKYIYQITNKNKQKTQFPCIKFSKNWNKELCFLTVIWP